MDVPIPARLTVWKWSGTSKIVGQESVTSKAGTFETLRIETTSSSSNLKDPTRTEQLTGVRRYASVRAYWVKRSWPSVATIT
jgi:hypothetical protein